MSVLVIQGPHRAATAEASLPSRMFETLAEKVRKAGSVLEVARCASAAGMVRCLTQARASGVDIVLLDGGELEALDCARHEDRLRAALDQLAAPYIELHDDAGRDLESRVRPTHCALAVIVMSHDLARSYAVGMGIALRRLAKTAANDAALPSSGALEA